MSLCRSLIFLPPSSFLFPLRLGSQPEIQEFSLSKSSFSPFGGCHIINILSLSTHVPFLLTSNLPHSHHPEKREVGRTVRRSRRGEGHAPPPSSTATDPGTGISPSPGSWRRSLHRGAAILGRLMTRFSHAQHRPARCVSALSGGTVGSTVRRSRLSSGCRECHPSLFN